MADYVAETGCGEVVENLTATNVLASIEALVGKYEDRQQSARQVGRRDFSRQEMLGSYRQLYEDVCQ